MSRSEVEIQGLAQTGEGQDGSARQPTGDRGVDDVLGKLDTLHDKPLDTQIEVIAQVHRVLQDRLGDLGQE